MNAAAMLYCLCRMTTNLSLEEFSELVKSIGVQSDSNAATLLWHQGIKSKAMLKLLTKEDMQSIDVNLGSRVAIYEHYHSSGMQVPVAPQPCLCANTASGFQLILAALCQQSLCMLHTGRQGLGSGPEPGLTVELRISQADSQVAMQIFGSLSLVWHSDFQLRTLTSGTSMDVQCLSRFTAASQPALPLEGLLLIPQHI